MIEVLKKTITALCLVLVFFMAFTLILGLNPQWHALHVPAEAHEKFSKERITAQTENLLLYLRNKSKLDATYYSQKEIIHLQDIQELVRQVKRLAILLVAAIIFLLPYHKKRIGSFINDSATITLAILSIATLLASLFFEQLFIAAHHILFNNDAWLLDPSYESLIILFNPEVFMNLFIQAGVLTAISLIVLLLYNKKS